MIMQFFVNGSPVCGDTVPLGVQGENLATQITADVSGWLDQWPGGQVIVRLIDANRQSHLANTIVNDGTLVWIVTAADTAQGGYGVGVIELVQGDVVKKSEPFATRVITDPQASGEAPEPVPGWVEETIARMEELEAGAAQSAGAAQTSAQSAQAGAQSAQAAAAQAAQSAEDAAAVLGQVEAAGAAQVSAVQAAGQQQTQAVSAAGAQQVSAVQTEGANQRAAIETAGAAQVNAVQAEGQTQQTAIQQKGADTLASIPSDYTELADDVTELKSQIIITEEQHPYEPTADYGRYTDGSAYNDYIPNHKLNVDTGEYVEDLNHSQYYTSETYYEIPNDSQIFSYMKNQGITSISINYCFYAADKSYLGRSTWVHVTTKTSEWNGLYGEYVTIPSNAKYFRVWSGLSNNFHAVVLTRDITYLVNIPNLVIDKPLSDIRLLALGDSIWGNDRTDGIADFLSEYTGMTVYNGAIGGTRITGDRGNYSSPEYKPFDGVNLIHALVTGVWTDQDANVDSIVSYVKTSTLPMLKSLDLSTVDIITLAYGHNDFTAPKTIESIQAAFVTAIGEILTAYPQVRIVVIAPPWRTFDSGQTDGDVWTNGNGNTLREVADAIVDCANSQHITSINMLNELPWRMDTAAYYLDSDKVHPNINGNRIYAHIIDGKIRSMY